MTASPQSSSPQSPLPIIDMATYRAGAPEAKARLVAEIAAVSRELGFFYLVNHGVPDGLLVAQLDWGRRFFDRPLADKLAVDLRHSPVRRGYEPMALQTLQAGMAPDQKEAFGLGREPVDGVVSAASFEGPNQWPAAGEGFDPAAFRTQMEAYRDTMTDLGRELCGLLAASLDLPEAYFEQALIDPSVNVRLLHYPPQPPRTPKDRLGCGAHTDWGLITILLQDDCGGLEIETGHDQWLRAAPVPGALIVNLGDMVVRLTAGRYASNVHRVINARPERHRYSVATFFNPHAAYVVDCAPTCVPETGASEPVTFGDHINEMIRKTYALEAA
jgi:isopenicillin N synthase-like dioxygenase